MLNIFFGNKFISLHQEQIEKLTQDSHFIMTTVFFNRNATTAIYKYFDTDSNRYVNVLCKFFFLTIPGEFWIPIFFFVFWIWIVLMYQIWVCNLQEQVKKAFCLKNCFDCHRFLVISNFLQILSFLPQISKGFLIISTIFSPRGSEQFWKQNAISTQ